MKKITEKKNKKIIDGTNDEFKDNTSFDQFFLLLLNNYFDKEMQNAKNKNEVIEKSYINLHGVIEEARIKKLNLLLSSYNGNYSNSLEIDESNKKYSGKDLLYIDLGKILAEHHKYLDQVKKELNSSNTKENKHYFLIKEQLLLLDHFGILKKLKANNNTNEAISFFLAGLLNRNAQDIRNYLGKLAIIKSPSNRQEKIKYKSELVSLKKVLDSLKIRSISNKLKTEIEKLEK